MADELITRYVDPDDDLLRAPYPFNHIVASPVYCPEWGRGWLGYTVVGDEIDLWFVHGDRSGTERLDYRSLLTYNDKDNSRLWLILVGVTLGEAGYYPERRASLFFLLNPPEDAVLFPVPAKVKSAIEEEYGGRRDRGTDEDE